MARKTRFDVDTQTKIIESTKQFVGGLKTVDTDDSLGSFFLRDAENISLSEYGFLEKRYGIVDDNDLQFSAAALSSLVHPHPTFRVQGYFEYVRPDGFYDQILFANGRLYLARPDNDVVDVPEIIDGRFHQVRSFSRKEDLQNISDELFNNYIANFVIDPTKQTQVQTRVFFDDLFYGVDEIEAVRIENILYIFNGVYPIIYDGDGKFYLLPEYIPNFSELKLNSHNIHNSDNAANYSKELARVTLQNGKFLPSFEPNVVFEYLDEAVYPRLPYTNLEGTIFTIEIAYQLHESLLPNANFTGFLGANDVLKLEDAGGAFAEIIPKVYYRPSGIGASNLEWIEIDKESLVYTRRTNLEIDDENFTVTDDTFKTLPATAEIDDDYIDYYNIEFDIDDKRAIHQSIRSQGPYKVEIQNMPNGDWDIRVDLILQTAGYVDNGGSRPAFIREVVSALSREYKDVTFTEEKLEDYLDIDPAGLWSCNRVINHFGKLMVYGSRVNPQRVFVGHPETIEYFPEFFTIDFETDNEQEIQKITSWMNILVVQSESFTWGLKGFQSLIDIDNRYTPFTINPIYGTIAPRSVRPVRNQLYFLSREGIVTLNSLFANDNQYNIRRIDENIENIVPLDKEAVAIQYDNQYWIHFPNSPDFMTLRYYIDTKSWMKDTYFEYNGLDAEGVPRSSLVIFNGIFKYIRKDGDLFMITHLMRLSSANNLRIFKLKIDDSIPTDLLETPRSLFETAYMNQGMPFHPKKYLEQRFDFTIQNEFNFARNGELYRELGVTPANKTYSLLDLIKLKPNHKYRIQVDQPSPSVAGEVLDPITNEFVPVFENLQYGITVAIKKDGQVITRRIAPISKTADPILFQDFSTSNQIFFRVLNNDNDNIDLYYDVDLSNQAKDPRLPNNYRNVIRNLGSRNITDQLVLTLDNIEDGSQHTLYLLAESRADLDSEPVSKTYTLSSVSSAPTINPVTAQDITNTTVSLSWQDNNITSSSFRVKWENVDENRFISSISGVSGNSFTVTNLKAGNNYRIYVQAEFEGRFSPESSVIVTTTTGLLTPEILNVTGTIQATTILYTDPNFEEQETDIFAQVQQDNLFVSETTPPFVVIGPADSTSGILPAGLVAGPHIVYRVRIKAYDEVNNVFSGLSEFRQFVFRPAPPPLSLGENTFTSIEIIYPNFNTVDEYEFRYKRQVDPDIEANWTTITKTYAQALADNFVLTIGNLEEAVAYDVQYRLKFIINTLPVFSESRTSIQATTDSSVPFTETPTVTTFSTTSNSITLRVTNNDAVPVTVLANEGDVDPTTSRGTINSTGGNLNVLFSNLPSPLSSYTFSIAARATDNSKLKSAKVLYTESTAATTTPAPTTTTTTTTTSAPGPTTTTTTTAGPTAPPPSCTAGWLSTYTCIGADRYRLYRYSDCSEQFLLWDPNASICGGTQAPTTPPGPTAPAAPNVSATGGSNTLSASWGQVSGATSYDWEVRNSNFSLVAGNSTTGTSIPSNEIPFLAAGSYSVRVRSRNSVGTSSYTVRNVTVTGLA